MELILKNLTEAYEELKKLISENQKKSEELQTGLADLSEKTDEYLKKNADLKEREAAITPVENLRKEQKEVAEGTRLLNEQRSTFQEEKNKFKTDSDARAQILNEREKDLNKIQESLNIQESRIKDAIQKGIEDFVNKFKKQGE